MNGEMAMRLARYFGTSPQFWMNLQNKYDIAQVSEAETSAVEKRVG